jgi:hypothetical protein
MLLAACGVVPDAGDAPATSRRAIVGGADDAADPQVFLIDMTFDNAAQTLCSAALLSPRTLVTAAHCVDPRRQSGASSVTVIATNKAVAATATTAERRSVVETRLHPAWDPGAASSPNDLAVLLLDTAVAGVAPKAVNRAGLSGFVGQPMRVVGYGRSDPAVSNSGTRRAVTLDVTSDDAEHIFFGTAGGAGICAGDSGGPSFHTFPDGVERIVGVHSYVKSPQCGDGADVRIDRFLPFLDQWVAEKDPALCSADGRCQAGCTPVDLDCVCAADGVCSAACPDLALDPDCSPDCVANGVCATASCPVPDPDCVSMGQPCKQATQCAGRKCTSDPVHPASYCSRACAAPGDCPTGMDCLGLVCSLGNLTPAAMGDACTEGVNLCADGTVCTGPQGASTTCRPACDAAGGCPTGATCEAGQGAAKYCQVVRAAANAEPGPAIGRVGCQATAGQTVSWAALLALCASVRRRG